MSERVTGGIFIGNCDQVPREISYGILGDHLGGILRGIPDGEIIEFPVKSPENIGRAFTRIADRISDRNSNGIPVGFYD